MSNLRNIGIVTSREYLSRVKKKSFIIMTFLAPLLITGFYGLIIFIMMNDISGKKTRQIAIYDASTQFPTTVKSTEKVNFTYVNSGDNGLLLKDTFDALVKIPDDFAPGKRQTFTVISTENISVQLQSSVEDALERSIKSARMDSMNISKETIDSLRTYVNLNSEKIGEDGTITTTNTGINTAVGMGLAFVIYFFIFIYGVQIMKGVIEEKTNRIVELIISTVKPFQLMMGKVIGLAMVGLTQIIAWIVLTSILTGVISLFFSFDTVDPETINQLAKANQGDAMSNLPQLMANIQSLPFFKILVSFLYFFLGGYLLYGALFAAIGAAVDQETDTQQFMLPVTMPLVFSIILSMSVVLNDPNGTLATVLSMIPFTAPITMMVRMPFDPSWTEIALSMFILGVSFITTIWLAGRIYKVGILMYGKKVKYKDLFKWMFSRS